MYSVPGRLAGFAILHAPYDVSMLPDRIGDPVGHGCVGLLAAVQPVPFVGCDVEHVHQNLKFQQTGLDHVLDKSSNVIPAHSALICYLLHGHLLKVQDRMQSAANRVKHLQKPP